jgi:hypothetical protein
MFDGDRFMRRVSSLTDCAHPIKRRYAERGSEIAVGAAARRRFFHGKAEFRSE